MCEFCPQQLFDVDPDVDMIAVACPKCREVATYIGASTATKAAVHHAKECGSDTVRIIEIMAAAPDTWTARAHN